MKCLLKLSLYLILTPLAFALVGDLCQKQTKGFRLQNIYPAQDYKTASSNKEPGPEEFASIEKILKQPFRFIKKGQQCFVFLSDDGKYVIKFFRWEKLEPPIWTKWIPGALSESLIQNRQRKLDFDFLSYKIALENLQEETGLIYLQPVGTPYFKAPIEIYDNIGIRHSVQADKTGFILQKKAEDFFPFFKEKTREGKEKDLRPFLSALVDLIENRVQNKITDSDVSLEYNMGVLDGKPILFDIGNLQIDSSSLSKLDLMKKQAALILSSLRKLSPDSALFLEKELELRSDHSNSQITPCK